LKLTKRSLIILISSVLTLCVGFSFLLSKGSLLKSASPSLLIRTDAPCKVNVDGDEIIMAQAGMVSVTVTSGQHLVSAMSTEENIVWEDLIYVPDHQELVVNIRLAAKIAAAKQKNDPGKLE
jgi:hypothetical protein